MTQPTPKDDEGRDAQIAQLVEDARSLNVSVGHLMGDTGHALVGMAERGRTNRRAIWLLALSLLLDVLLTVAMGFTIGNSRNNTDRIDKLSVNLRVQLCAELGLFKNADNPTANAAAKARGDDMAVRAKSFEVIRESYVSLDCAAIAK